MNETNFLSHADDDNMPYRTANTTDEVNTRSESLEHDSMMLFQWFSEVV